MGRDGSEKKCAMMAGVCVATKRRAEKTRMWRGKLVGRWRAKKTQWRYFLINSASKVCVKCALFAFKMKSENSKNQFYTGAIY
jgi:hypothetical protein